MEDALNKKSFTEKEIKNYFDFKRMIEGVDPSYSLLDAEEEITIERLQSAYSKAQIF